jgi:hypothetical protein
MPEERRTDECRTLGGQASTDPRPPEAMTLVFGPNSQLLDELRGLLQVEDCLPHWPEFPADAVQEIQGRVGKHPRVGIAVRTFTGPNAFLQSVLPLTGC